MFLAPLILSTAMLPFAILLMVVYGAPLGVSIAASYIFALTCFFALLVTTARCPTSRSGDLIQPND